MRGSQPRNKPTGPKGLRQAAPGKLPSVTRRNQPPCRQGEDGGPVRRENPSSSRGQGARRFYLRTSACPYFPDWLPSSQRDLVFSNTTTWAFGKNQDFSGSSAHMLVLGLLPTSYLALRKSPAL